MTKTFYFATSNRGKFAEAQEKFRAAGLKLKRKPVDLLEIQSDDLVEISRISARELAKTFKKPFFVEDAGLFVKALNGFPGPYS
ncbi:TPA: non-canonical purine NTP pyrophosphatase, partial [archaeon]|nr:non-canonical purine NTP pyrophosphatase [Candidatus Naiadarchaeum limnaeum]